MRGFFERRLKGAGCVLVFGLLPMVAASQNLLKAGFAGRGPCSSAFVVGPGGEVVTLGEAGRNLSQARLIGAPIELPAKVVDEVSRLVVFKVPNPWAEGLALAEVAPNGGKLSVAEDRLELQITGRVTQKGGKYLPFTLLELAWNGRFLMPGSPLLDANDEVAAVVYQDNKQGSVLAIPVEVLHRTLRDVRRHDQIRRSWVGVTLEIGGKTPRIKGVAEGSPAAQSGLQAGDLMVAIGERRIDAYGDMVNATFLLTPGEPTVIKFKRGKVESKCQLIPVAEGE